MKKLFFLLLFSCIFSFCPAISMAVDTDELNNRVSTLERKLSSLEDKLSDMELTVSQLHSYILEIKDRE